MLVVPSRQHTLERARAEVAHLANDLTKQIKNIRSLDRWQCVSFRLSVCALICTLRCIEGVHAGEQLCADVVDVCALLFCCCHIAQLLDIVESCAWSSRHGMQ